jgi:hypothetical protein
MFDGEAFGKQMVDIVKGFVSKAVDPLTKRIEELEMRVPERGEKGDPGRDGVDGAAGQDGTPGRDGIDGKDGSPGEKGIDGTNGLNGRDGQDGADGKDGVGLADAVIDRKGGLVLTMTDGRTKELGQIVGTDGEQGAPGKDGRDGLGFDDLEVIHDGERSFTFRFVRGEQVKEFPFKLPVILDRGVYREGDAYEKGDAVTWAGSVWIAQKDGVTDKPDGGDGWRLSVKRGRDGKPGKDGELKAHQPVKVG